MSYNNYRKCAKCGKTRAEDMSVSFHRFPNPGLTNLLKARAWAQYCWPSKTWDWESLSSLHLSSKVLCGRHFDYSQFFDSERKNLCRFAVPDVKILTDLRQEKENIFKEGDYLLDQETKAKTSAPKLKTKPDKTQISNSPNITSTELNAELPQPSNGLESGVLPQSSINEPTSLVNNVSDDGNLQELEDHHEDSRSPSPEPDIEVNLCRICLQSFSKLLSIESYGLGTAYEQLTGVSVEHDDGLPRELCVECATLLDKYHKFRDKSIKGDQLLRQIYNQDGVTDKIPLEEIEQAISNLASKIDYSAEVTCIDIEPEDTESKVTESKDESNDKTDISKTNENKVKETDLDMSVDEPVDEEWLDLPEVEDMRSQTATSDHDIDDEVSIKEEELDLDGDHTDPLHTVDVNTQTEVPSISEPESQHKDTTTQRRSSNKQPEEQIERQQTLLDILKARKSLPKQRERQIRNIKKLATYDRSCVKQPKIQQINLFKSPRKQQKNVVTSKNQLLNLLKDSRMQEPIILVKQPRKQHLRPLNQPETQQMNIVKDPETHITISLVEDPETQHINIVKDPETQNTISVIKQPGTQNLSLLNQPESQHIDIAKHPESQNINIAKDPETQQISLIEQPRDISLSKDTNIQQESQIKAHYSIQKLDVRDQRTINSKKRNSADYLISKYKCKFCCEGFKTENDIKRHIVQHADQGQLLCTICRCRFRELQHLKEHVQDRHQYIYNCRMCHRDILTRTQALQHINKHLPFVCLNR